MNPADVTCNIPKIKVLRCQHPSPEKDECDDHIIWLTSSLAESPVAWLAQYERFVGISSNSIQVYAFLRVYNHQCDLVLIIGWAAERNSGFFDDFGDILDELVPGFFPFRLIPAKDGIVVRVTVSFSKYLENPLIMTRLTP